MPLLPKNKTVIFLDLDGVIFDSYGLWDEVIEKVLAIANISYTQTIKKHLWRLNMVEAQAYLSALFAKENLPYPEKKTQQLLEGAYQKVSLMPHAVEMIADLAKEDFLIYAVTSNYDDLAKIGLESTGVLQYFSGIYSCIALGFPDKTDEFYRAVLEIEGLSDKTIFYLEDSTRHLKTAQKFGIQGVYLSNTDNPQDNQEQAFCTIRHLKEFITIVKEEMND
ncbi:Phosphoglycolate phosphatase, HAD superfamily [Streptococcus equinus JB1]|uniref:Phosphoglycolate phosphatase, HAD superfamily n=1 Tax=Streptococcus equinus JB1 TaxID=1294274 RepID=A0A1I4GRQ0_STREI|nr:Phosphoglycolate phosphatase, HAD superfamily [Streptococcus equinus JB1]